jgi:ADP-ribosylglycohydrolase
MERQKLPRVEDVSIKITNSLFGLAMCDALGGPAEFHARDTFPCIDSMVPNDNFMLPAGVWTDDTSMALCLAASLIERPGGAASFSVEDQAARYVDWWQNGYMSAVGECFDVGMATRQALGMWMHDKDTAWELVQRGFVKQYKCGNGSLMRVLPVALMFWRDQEEAMRFARRSSTVTHPHPLCQEACAVYVLLVSKVLQWAEEKVEVSKMDLLDVLQSFPFESELLKDTFGKDSMTSFVTKPRSCISSSGYVLCTLEAALWAFFTTESFEEGAILVANLGDDADTVGAVYGGLAGAWHADAKFSEHLPQQTAFWSPRVREWRKALVESNVVGDIAKGLVKVNHL